MDSRTMRKFRAQSSPERSRFWTEPVVAPPPSKLCVGKKVPVIYYLSRNRHLEHPHFIEVPVSSPQGIFLRDVINRLNVLRGKGMAAMYSWSCKRSYKTGFVWHDLSEDDLVLPAQGNEYVLKGSELMERSPSDRTQNGIANSKLESFENAQHAPSSSSRVQTVSASCSPPTVVIKEAKPAPTIAPRLHYVWEAGSLSPVEHQICKLSGAQDAGTQTEDRERRVAHRKDTCNRGISADDSAMDLDSYESPHNRSLKPKGSPEIEREKISPPLASSLSSTGRTETLESLIRAEMKMNGYRFLEDDQVLVSTRSRLKATNFLMHLITCGSISVKDHQNFGLVTNYRTMHPHGELLDNPRLMGLRMEDKEYFSGSLIETKKQLEDAEEGVPTLKRSSSFNADRSSKLPELKMELERVVDSSLSKCLPKTVKTSSNKKSRNETIRSPMLDVPRMSQAVLECSKALALCSPKDGSTSITASSSVRESSMRLESFRETEKVIQIEESLLQELGL